MKSNKGMSLIEILVVVTIFALMGVVVARAIILTIRGSKKSESIVKIRENINYSVGIIERQLRNADLVLECPNSDPSRIDYQDQFGNLTSFSCTGGYIASDSARLTSDAITITSCAFVCAASTVDNPPSVTVSLTAKDTNAQGIENSSVSTINQIYLRNY